MLLIDDGQAKVFEGLFLPQQCVRANQHLQLSFGQSGRQLLPVSLLGIAGE